MQTFQLEGFFLLLLLQATAAANNISATPTFLLFRNRVRIDQYQGADASGLEDKIKQHVENDPGSNEDSDIPKGYVSLLCSPSPFGPFDRAHSESLDKMWLSPVPLSPNLAVPCLSRWTSCRL